MLRCCWIKGSEKKLESTLRHSITQFDAPPHVVKQAIDVRMNDGRAQLVAEAVNQLRLWGADGLTPPIAVNISARDLQDDSFRVLWLKSSPEAPSTPLCCALKSPSAHAR